MTPILELGDSSNWVEFYSASVSAIIINSDNHVPIPEILVPFSLEQNVLAIFVSTQIPEGSKWLWAGYFKQKIILGINAGENSAFDSYSSRKIFLNKIKLITFPKITTTYTVSFSVPHWFKNIDLTIWKYVGTDNP